MPYVYPAIYAYTSYKIDYSEFGYIPIFPGQENKKSYEKLKKNKIKGVKSQTTGEITGQIHAEMDEEIKLL